MLGDFKLPANIEKYAAIDEYKIHEEFLIEAKKIKKILRKEKPALILSITFYLKAICGRVYLKSRYRC